jgi:hypothetical protein
MYGIAYKSNFFVSFLWQTLQRTPNDMKVTVHSCQCEQQPLPLKQYSDIVVQFLVAFYIILPTLFSFNSKFYFLNLGVALCVKF